MVEFRWFDKLGSDVLLITSILILCHQSVHAVVDVGGVDQLQTAVILALGRFMNHGAYVVLLF